MILNLQLRRNRLYNLLYGMYSMFDWLYNLFMQLVTFVLSLFGMNEKKVHFENEGLENNADGSDQQALLQAQQQAQHQQQEAQ